MRWAAAIVAFAAALGFVPLSATPTPTFAISSPSAKAGSPETFTISRVSGGSGAYVLFQTYDGTARAGTDYAATEQLVYVKAGVSSVTVSVPTTVNPTATGNLTFIGVIASTRTPSTGTATIVEPVAPPVQCPDGTTVPAGQTCPTPIQPTGSWGTAPLTVGGYACNATQLADPKTPACGMGVVFKIIGTGCNGIGPGTAGAPCANLVYLTQFYSDASKQFPTGNSYDTAFVAVWTPEQLQGLAPTSP